MPAAVTVLPQRLNPKQGQVDVSYETGRAYGVGLGLVLPSYHGDAVNCDATAERVALLLY